MSIDNQQHKRLTFDPTINAGHVLTFASIMLAGVVGWNTLDKRVVSLEEARKAQAQTDQHQDSMTRAGIDAVRESLREIKEGVNKLNDKIERRAP